jgi:hypothetical protein
MGSSDRRSSTPLRAMTGNRSRRQSGSTQLSWLDGRTSVTAGLAGKPRLGSEQHLRRRFARVPAARVRNYEKRAVLRFGPVAAPVAVAGADATLELVQLGPPLRFGAGATEESRNSFVMLAEHPLSHGTVTTSSA